MKNSFVKSHGLGNDYIILNSYDISFLISPENIRKICDVHFGIGSDGILLKVPSDNADFGLRIYNPDGSEAEKSGNGLRIFAKYLFDHGFTANKSFTIDTAGGIVCANIMEEVNSKVRTVRVDMGKAIFKAKDIPVISDNEECFDEQLDLPDTSYNINCVSVGNPHCVIVKNRQSVDEIMKYGKLIENHKKFPNRINVQFAKVISDNEVEALIWERGAGYTLASGSSSCAVAAVLLKKGLTSRNMIIKMPGGSLQVEIDEEWNIKMTGEVKEVATGVLSDELVG